MHLDIHVTFTAGHFHGFEWPPAPARLFQALVAGTHRGAPYLVMERVHGRNLRQWLAGRPAAPGRRRGHRAVPRVDQ